MNPNPELAGCHRLRKCGLNESLKPLQVLLYNVIYYYYLCIAKWLKWGSVTVSTPFIFAIRRERVPFMPIAEGTGPQAHRQREFGMRQEYKDWLKSFS